MAAPSPPLCQPPLPLSINIRVQSRRQAGIPPFPLEKGCGARSAPGPGDGSGQHRPQPPPETPLGEKKSAKVPFEFFHQCPNKYIWAGKSRRQIPSCYSWALSPDLFPVSIRAEKSGLSHPAEPPLAASLVSPLFCIPLYSHSGKVPPLTYMHFAVPLSLSLSATSF